MMEESRKQFEEAFEEITGWESEDYPNEDYVDTLWRIWQASRAAIEIELPVPAYSRMDIQAATMHRLNLCKKAIRAAGLKIKGE